MRSLVLLSLLLPVAAQAGVKKEAKAFFAAYEQAIATFDVAGVDMYRDDAIITVVQHEGEGQTIEQEITGTQLKAGAELGLEAARERGDYDTFSDVAYIKVGERVRIEATRYNHYKCTTDDDFSLTIGRDDSGTWRIERMRMTAWAYSQCEDAPSPAAQRAAFLAQTVGPQLPVEVAPGVVLQALTADDTTLNYEMRLTELTGDVEDLQQRGDEARAAGMAQSCADANVGQLLSIGIEVRYHLLTADGADLVDYTVSSDTCAGQ